MTQVELAAAAADARRTGGQPATPSVCSGRPTASLCTCPCCAGTTGCSSSSRTGTATPASTTLSASPLTSASVRRRMPAPRPPGCRRRTAVRCPFAASTFTWIEAAGQLTCPTARTRYETQTRKDSPPAPAVRQTRARRRPARRAPPTGLTSRQLQTLHGGLHGRGRRPARRRNAAGRAVGAGLRRMAGHGPQRQASPAGDHQRLRRCLVGLPPLLPEIAVARRAGGRPALDRRHARPARSIAASQPA